MKEIYQAIVSPPAIVKQDLRRSDEVREKVLSIDLKSQMDAFDMGEYLAELDENAYWKDDGVSNLDDWVKKVKLNVSIRTVRYRIKTAKMSALLGIERKDLVAAKTSKLDEIFTLDPTAVVKDEQTGTEESMADIIRKLVREAPFKTLDDIKKIVQGLKNADLDPEDELTWINLPIRRDAKDTVTRAIDLAKALSGSMVDEATKEVKDISDAMALERICGDFLADPNNVAEDLGTTGDYHDSFDEFGNPPDDYQQDEEI